jgi:hypothetical protein
MAMKRCATSLFFLGAALVWTSFSGWTPVQAQEPKPPVREFPPLIEGRGEQDSGQEPVTDLRPDDRPLTGVQVTSLGTQEMRHSYWVPGFQYANMIRSTSFSQPGVTNWNSTSYLTGNISLLDTWSHGQLSMNYSGGGGSSTDTTQSKNYFHQFGMTQTFNRRRWQLQFIDQFSYLPETQFGFGAATNLSLPGVGGSIAPPGPGLQNNYVPNQSILSSTGPRYSNSFATQVVYTLSRRTSITAAGSYGLMRFVDAGNINSDEVIANLGFNYTLTTKDTLGVLYRFTGYQYSGNPQRIDDHVVNVAYGRKVTGRLALQLFGGPDITTFKIPIASAAKRVSASGGATLTYAMSRSGMSLTYNHGISNGSGVLVGSSTDQISTSMNRGLGRAWRGSINFGYAKNRSVAQNQTQNSPSFDSYFAGAGLDRQLGRNATFSLGYTAYIQGTMPSVCTAGACSTSSTQHQISLGFTWHTRPYVLH